LSLSLRTAKHETLNLKQFYLLKVQNLFFVTYNIATIKHCSACPQRSWWVIHLCSWYFIQQSPEPWFIWL